MNMDNVINIDTKKECSFEQEFDATSQALSESEIYYQMYLSSGIDAHLQRSMKSFEVFNKLKAA